MKNLVLLGGVTVICELCHVFYLIQFEGYNVTLVDRMPFHGLKPEFYALAAGTKSDKDVRMRFPDNNQINTVYGEINDIDLDAQIISVGNSKLTTMNLL